MERDSGSERVTHAISKPKAAREHLGGRPVRITASRIRCVMRLADDGEPAVQVAQDPDMSRATFYKHSGLLIE